MKRLIFSISMLSFACSILSGQTKDGISTTGNRQVDLGLSVMWGTCNVGADNPEEYGDYFAWGETRPKNEYSWSTYIYNSDNKGKKFSKYVNRKRQGNRDKKSKLDLSDDAAHVILGGNWRMPTHQEQYELITECRFVLEELNGVKGYRAYSRVNNNSIFIPFAGAFHKESVIHNDDGSYWTSELEPHGSLFDRGSANARMYVILKDDVGQGSSPRFIGMPVRPVWDPNLSSNN